MLVALVAVDYVEHSTLSRHVLVEAVVSIWLFARTNGSV